MKKIRKNSSNINKILHEKITIISSGLITIKLKKYLPTAEEHIEEKIPEKKIELQFQELLLKYHITILLKNPVRIPKLTEKIFSAPYIFYINLAT